jgi:hypothetical protein
MDIAIDNKDLLYGLVGQKTAYGDAVVVDHAETLAMAAKRVMKPAAVMVTSPFLQGQTRGQDASAGAQPGSGYQFRREPYLQLLFLFRGQCAALKLSHVFLGMDKQDIGIRRRIGPDEVGFLKDTAFDQPLFDKPVFARPEYMIAHVDLVFRGVN